MFANQGQNTKLGAISSGCQVTPAVESIAGSLINELDFLINRLMSASDRAESLGDRLLGCQPSSDAKAEGRPYPSGMWGEIAQKIDTLKTVTSAIECNVDRLQRLG